MELEVRASDSQSSIPVQTLTSKFFCYSVTRVNLTIYTCSQLKEELILIYFMEYILGCNRLGNRVSILPMGINLGTTILTEYILRNRKKGDSIV